MHLTSSRRMSFMPFKSFMGQYCSVHRSAFSKLSQSSTSRQHSTPDSG